MSDTKVLYIGGLGRSGSTLLDRMLGQLPGFFSGGEIREIWHRALQQNAMCGCGQHFRECPFWSEVGRRAYGGWDRIDPEAVLRLARSVDKHRWIPLLLAPRLWPPFARRLERYVQYLAPLYRAIHDVGRTRAIIDSSKAPSTAFVLRRIPGLDLRMVHLVRDSRGVAFSWTKEVLRPDIAGETVYMHRFQPSRIGFRWVTRNSLMEMLCRRGRGVRIHYESLIAAPRVELARVLECVGEPAGPGELDFIQDGHVDLGPNHTVMGNPARLQVGKVPLGLDDEWKTRMGPKQSGMVTALTWPLLRRYGYRR